MTTDRPIEDFSPEGTSGALVQGKDYTLVALKVEDVTSATRFFQTIQSQFLGLGYSPVERRDMEDICVHYEKGEEDVFLLLKGNYVIKMKEESVGDGGEVAEVATPTPTLEEPEVIEICVVNYTRAPKTWTIDMPQNYNKVEAGVYGKGEDKVNQYGGWAAYMKLNGDYAWKFL